MKVIEHIELTIIELIPIPFTDNFKEKLKLLIKNKSNNNEDDVQKMQAKKLINKYFSILKIVTAKNKYEKIEYKNIPQTSNLI